MPSELENRVLSASSVVVGGTIATLILRIANNLIMTRLLVPDMFALMALAGVILSGLRMLSDMGLRQNIIYSEHGEDPRFLNTVWTIQMTLGLLVATIMLLCGAGLALLQDRGWIASASSYAHPDLPMVIMVLSAAPLMHGFRSTKIHSANRQLRVGRAQIYALAAQGTAMLAMIGLGLIFQSIWVLVIGALTASLVQLILSHIGFPGPTNRLHFDRSCAADIFGFGRWVLVSSSLAFLNRNLSIIILGGFLGASTLGLFTICHFLVYSVRDIFQALSGRVIFPLFSEVQRSQTDKLAGNYYHVRLIFDILLVTGAAILCAAAPHIIGFVYDPRYNFAGDMLAIFGVMLFFIRFDVDQAVYNAMGKPKRIAVIQAVDIALTAPALCLALWFGDVLDGMMALIGARLITHLFMAMWRRPLIPWRIGREIIAVIVFPVMYFASRLILAYGDIS